MDIADYFAHLPTGPTEIDLVGPFCQRYTPHPTRPVMFVDAGARWQTPGVGISVGDGDSFDGLLDVRIPTEKDESDLRFALRHVPESVKKVYLHGFLGGRRDHEMFNIGEVHALLQSRQGLQAIFDEHVLAFSAGQWSLMLQGTYSLVVLEAVQISMRGKCRYPLDNAHLSVLSSYGLSNVGSGQVDIDCSGAFFIFTSKSCSESGSK